MPVEKPSWKLITSEEVLALSPLSREKFSVMGTGSLAPLPARLIEILLAGESRNWPLASKVSVPVPTEKSRSESAPVMA